MSDEPKVGYNILELKVGNVARFTMQPIDPLAIRPFACAHRAVFPNLETHWSIDGYCTVCGEDGLGIWDRNYRLDSVQFPLADTRLTPQAKAERGRRVNALRLEARQWAWNWAHRELLGLSDLPKLEAMLACSSSTALEAVSGFWPKIAP